MENVVAIHAMFEGEADHKLAKLARRAAKYGQTIAWAKEPYKVIEKRRPVGGKIYEVAVPMIRYTVQGAAPKVGPFEFIAELEQVDDGVIVTGKPVELEGFGRDWRGECQHCGLNRDRRLGYVVRHTETGEFKIVGKSCLADHVGERVPAQAIAMFQWLRDIAAMGDEEEGWGRRGRWTRDTVGVIMAARAAIRLFGWVPRGQRQDGLHCTAECVGFLDWHNPRDDEARKIKTAILAELDSGREDYVERAQAIIAWAAELPARSDYERNLKVAVKSSFVIDKTFGLVVSASAAFDRQQAREDEAAARKAKEAAEREAIKGDDKRNAHFGEIGARVECEIGLVAMRGTPDRGFGPGVLHTFYGPDGQVLKWFTSKGLGHPGDRIKAKFTVKKHGEFNGMKETIITRVAKLALVARV